nr:hypothetical protein [Tanacetum cinerariifolium]GEX55422.1 hypothetical protein [Tanacetum cinerariifolium]GEX55426.1 hypothetical protein [Tanacetum cinerariifolium]
MLRVFPVTLTGAAKRWVDRLPPGTVNSCDLLKKAFIKRYCLPSKTAKQLKDICNFKQEGDEALYQAWERGQNRQLFDSQGQIPGLKPVQALTAFYNMVNNSQKWPTWILHTHGQSPTSWRKEAKLRGAYEQIPGGINAKKDRDGRIVKYGENQERGLIWEERLEEWCTNNPNTPTSGYTKVQRNHNPIPKDNTFKDWILTKVGHTNMFDQEINQLADEYELGIGKKEHMLDDIWENYRKVQRDNTYWWHDQKSEEEERRKIRINIEEYDPPMVHVETFKVLSMKKWNSRSLRLVFMRVNLTKYALSHASRRVTPDTPDICAHDPK